jgi:GntR family transcriptional regulator
MAQALYERIAEDLRNKIKSGRLAAGARLTPEPGLQQEYSERPEFSSAKVSRNTVRDAISLLVLEGLVEKRAGQGTFVVEKIDPFRTTLSGNPEGGESAAYQSEVTRRGHKPEETEPRVEIHFASRAPELQLDENDQVVSRYQARYIDGKPYSLQTSFYPRRYVNEGADRLDNAGEIEQGAVAYIQQTLGIKQVGWRDEAHVRIADVQESDFFGLAAKSGAQVLETRRTAYANGGQPIRLTVTVYAADRNILAYEAGQVPTETLAPDSEIPDQQ